MAAYEAGFTGNTGSKKNKLEKAKKPADTFFSANFIFIDFLIYFVIYF